MTTRDRIVNAILLLAFFGAFALSKAYAQTQPWDTNVVRWTNPVDCTNGQPITACSLTGYRVEHSTGSSWSTLTTIPNLATLSYTHANVGAGTHCYRVVWLSVNGPSAPSVQQPCVQNAPPAVPNPGTVTVTAGVVALAGRAPVYTLASGRVSTFLGLIPAGRKLGPVVTTYNGQQFCEYDGVRDELWNKPAARSTLVAACRGV